MLYCILGSKIAHNNVLVVSKTPKLRLDMFNTKSSKLVEKYEPGIAPLGMLVLSLPGHLFPFSVSTTEDLLSRHNQHNLWSVYQCCLDQYAVLFICAVL